MEGLLLIIFILGFSFFKAQFLGAKKQIGFGWSFFFSLFLSAIGGLIVKSLSKSIKEPAPQPSNAKKLWSWIIIVFFSFSFLGQLGSMGSQYGDSQTRVGTLSFAIGLIGLGIYLLALAKGTVFNTTTSTSYMDKKW